MRSEPLGKFLHHPWLTVSHDRANPKHISEIVGNVWTSGNSLEALPVMVESLKYLALYGPIVVDREELGIEEVEKFRHSHRRCIVVLQCREGSNRSKAFSDGCPGAFICEEDQGKASITATGSAGRIVGKHVEDLARTPILLSLAEDLPSALEVRIY